MTATTSPHDHFAAKMRAAGMPELAIQAFWMHLDRLLQGESGKLAGDQISPITTLPDAERFGRHHDAGRAALARTAVIKLNGGLGTSMGLERAKSLLPVRGSHSFLDLIATQVLALRRQTGTELPVLFMNSFRTDEDTERALQAYDALPHSVLGLGFRQHRVPKVDAETRRPARWPEDPELEWCPPGHGDLYTALVTSGLLRRLLELGFEYAFVSNADNLGAVLDTGLLGFMANESVTFMMEAADRTTADRKGGHLCRLDDGRLALRELAQCPEDEQDEFQDVELFRYFNTNNIWLRLPSLARLLEANDGVLPLPTIVNRKTLDPRDPSSPKVIQLESAMGAAISLFPEATAVRVRRTRFSPVKTTNDLLAVRSDAYDVTEDGRVVLAGDRSVPPAIALDRSHFKLVDDFDRRFEHGIPSLRRCSSLTVEGDVFFGTDVDIAGDVRIVSPDGRGVVPSGTVLEDEELVV